MAIRNIRTLPVLKKKVKDSREYNFFLIAIDPDTILSIIYSEAKLNRYKMFNISTMIRNYKLADRLKAFLSLLKN